MRRFIFTERGGIYIIDLQQTLELLEEARRLRPQHRGARRHDLFVGTKKQAQDAVENHAKRVGIPYVNHRWLGGLLTNWHDLEPHPAAARAAPPERGQLELLPSKERIESLSELEGLRANLGGVADMKKQPDAFVLDLRKEQLALAVTEARP